MYVYILCNIKTFQIQKFHLILFSNQTPLYSQLLLCRRTAAEKADATVPTKYLQQVEQPAGAGPTVQGGSWTLQKATQLYKWLLSYTMAAFKGHLYYDCYSKGPSWTAGALDCHDDNQNKLHPKGRSK